MTSIQLLAYFYLYPLLIFGLSSYIVNVTGNITFQTVILSAGGISDIGYGADDSANPQTWLLFTSAKSFARKLTSIIF